MERLESTFSQDQEVWSHAMEAPMGKIICSTCHKPTGIIHDLGLSVCCYAPIEREGRSYGKH